MNEVRARDEFPDECVDCGKVLPPAGPTIDGDRLLFCEVHLAKAVKRLGRKKGGFLLARKGV